MNPSVNRDFDRLVQEQYDRDRGVRRPEAVYGLIQRVGAAELLDRAVKRIASEVDPTDTDEGAERVETALTAAILAAIRSVTE